MSKTIDISEITMDNFYDKIRNNVVYKKTKMTVGQFILNKILGEDYIDKYGLITVPVNKKKFNQIIKDLAVLYQNDSKIFKEKVNTMKSVSERVHTILGPSFTIEDVTIFKKFDEDRKKITKEKDKFKRLAMVKELQEEVREYARNSDTNWADFLNSGAAGKMMGAVGQLIGSKGEITDTQNDVVDVFSKPVAGGLSPSEMMSASRRKGVADRALSTAITGYLERKLVYACSSIVLDPDLEDCGTKRTLNLNLTDEIKKRLQGRWAINRAGNKILLKSDILDKIQEGSVLKLRSPMFCKSPKICRTCFGMLYNLRKTEDIGVLAGTTLGERGSQLIMRSFHVGAGSDVKVVDLLEDMTNNQNEYTRKTYDSLFQQRKNLLYNRVPMTLIIKYDKPNEVDVDKEGNIFLPVVGGVVKREGKIIPLNLDFAVKIPQNSDIIASKEKGYFAIEINKKDVLIFSVETEVVNISVFIAQVLKILESTNENPDVYYKLNRIFSRYKDNTDIDFVHFEIIMTACLRNRKNPFMPARLVEPYEAAFYSIKMIPYLEDYRLGLQFENLTKAIEMGILETIERGDSETEKTPSPLIRI